jgi:SAM-dependent methyltransferase
MEDRLQRRVQRYGWDLASAEYEPLWQAQLEGVQTRLLAAAALAPGERVLDVACGTGLVTRAAARAVAPRGTAVGVDLSGRMIDIAVGEGVANATFARMDAEDLHLPDGEFDVVLCALGLMYVPDPARALREMRRVLRPGGRIALAVWGERTACGWSAVFPIVEAEVASEVCPLFFGLGEGGALAGLCEDAGYHDIDEQRLDTVLRYPDGDAACDAAFVGGPVAMAWSRFDGPVRARVRERYLAAIQEWRTGAGYAVPARFVIVRAAAGAATLRLRTTPA